MTLAEKISGLAGALVVHLRRHWITWIFALLAAFLFKENYVLGDNSSKSLPEAFFLVHRNEPVVKGAPGGFWWSGAYSGNKPKIFVKVVRGVEGDLITRAGREFFVNGESVGVAKEFSKRGEPLEPLAIPDDGYRLKPGEFWFWSPHVDSFDSRYALVGVIPSSRLVGRARGFL